MTGKVTGGAMVDNHIPNSGSYSVAEDSGTVYNAYLMYVDCDGNNNKFYVIQLLKKGSSYSLWNRWGRVGVPG